MRIGKNTANKSGVFMKNALNLVHGTLQTDRLFLEVSNIFKRSFGSEI